MFETIPANEENVNGRKEIGEELLLPRRKKIMLIDDDINFRLAMAEVLVDNGYEVTTAKDGEVALEHLKHEHHLPDLIMVDIVMPVKGGLEFRREQEKDEDLADIPVVFVSGQGIVDGELCLQKPFDQEEFLEYVKQYV